jgi:hypothetical protein
MLLKLNDDRFLWGFPWFDACFFGFLRVLPAVLGMGFGQNVWTGCGRLLEERGFVCGVLARGGRGGF